MCNNVLKHVLRVLFSASILLLAFGTLACAQVKLDFWLLSDSYTEPYERMLDSFKADMLAKYDIDLKYKWVTSQNLDEMFVTAVLAKKGYDLAWEWQGATFNKRVASGNFMPLDKYFPKAEYGDYAAYNDLLFDGRLYGLSFQPFPNGIMVYNKGLFRQAGLDPDDYPKTWCEFLSVCDTLQAAGITPLVMGNKGGLTNEVVFNTWGLQPFDNAEQMWHIVSKEGTWLQPELIRLLHMYKELYDKGYFQKDGMSYTFEESYSSAMIGDQAAMGIYHGPTAYASLKDARGTDIAGMFPLPKWAYGKFNDAVPILNMVVGIAPWTKHVDESVTIMREFLSEKYQTKQLVEADMFPACPTVDVNLVQDPYIRDLMMQMQRNAATIWYGFYSHAEWQAQIRYMSLFLLGEVSAEEVLMEMDKAKGKI